MPRTTPRTTLMAGTATPRYNLPVNSMSPMLGLLAWDSPAMLPAVAFALIPPAIAILARRRGRLISPLSTAAQTLAIVLLAAALAGPRLSLGDKSLLPYAVFQDSSASVRGQSPRALPWPDGLPRTDYVFAADVARAGDRPTSMPAEQSAATNLSNVLRIAAADSRNLAGAVVVSDGQWPDDWSAAARAYAQTRRPLLIVPLQSPPADARVTLSARRNADGSVRLSVSAESNAPMRRRLTVTRVDPPAVLLDREVTLLPQSPSAETLSDSPPGKGLAVYRARLAEGDAFSENDSASAMVLPLARRLAIVAKGDASAIADPLRAALDVDVIDAARAPSTADAWMPYSCVAMLDPRGDLLSPASRAAIAGYVRSGGGLVLVGAGPYASPSDRDDPLNSVAALVANPYQRTPLRVVVALDASGSMAEDSASPGQTKFQLACQAVSMLSSHLTPQDSLAVVVYSSSARRLYDSGPNPPDFAALSDALRKVSPEGGPTNVLPALELAVSSPPPEGKQPLLLLVSDLLTEAFDKSSPQAQQIDALEQSIRKALWKLSIVATRSPLDAPQAHTALEELSSRLGSELIRREGLAGIADVFRQFISRARGEPLAKGKFEVRFIPGDSGLGELALPTIDEYLLCGLSPSAAVVGSVGADPLAALRQVGLGRSASLALPLSPADNPPLLANTELHKVLAAMVRWAQRPGDDGRYSLRTQERNGRVLIQLDAGDASGPINGLELTAKVTSAGLHGHAQKPFDYARGLTMPPSEVSVFPLPQVAPGRYECSTPSPAEESFVAISAGERVLCVRPLEYPYPQEFAAIGANWKNLQKLAELTGGRVVSAGDLESLTLSMRREAMTPVWPPALAAAMLLMLLDWCGGRVLRRS